MTSDIFLHRGQVTEAHRQQHKGHRGAVVWFTGLSASGKSTIAHAVEHELFERGCHAYVLVGDNIRHGLCGDLGFSQEDLTENVRRVAEVAKLFVDAGLIVLTAPGHRHCSRPERSLKSVAAARWRCANRATSMASTSARDGETSGSSPEYRLATSRRLQRS